MDIQGYFGADACYVLKIMQYMHRLLNHYISKPKDLTPIEISYVSKPSLVVQPEQNY